MALSDLSAHSLLNPDSSSLRIPIRHFSTSGPSGAVLIARVLDSGGAGRIAEALASGSARNLSQAINQLNPSERNALRARWGRSLDELISLSNERDARVFHHGLLQVGRRLEDGDQVDLAGVVYSALVAEGGGEEVVPPLRLRGGQEGLLSSEVATQAQRRLNAINGVGDWRERLAFSLQRIPNQATRWDVLLAMTGAGFTFRGFRLLTTASWAGSFESALALNAASASTAFLAETIAFTSLGKVAGALAGHPQDTSANGIFNEWAGGAAMLLGLKGMGALTGAGVRSIYGEAGAVGARHAVPLRRFTEIFAPQAGMFMGILVGHRLAEAGGFHPARHGDTWLVDGITTLIEFNVAGRIQRTVGGPALISLEGRMEAMTRNIGHGFGRPGEIWDGRSKDRPLPGIFESMPDLLQPEFVTPEGLRFPAFENRHSKIENSNVVFSVASGAGDGGNRPKPPGGSTGRSLSPPPGNPEPSSAKTVGEGFTERDVIPLESGALLAPDEASFLSALRTFIEAQPQAIAIARMREEDGLGKLYMINRVFREQFGYMERPAEGSAPPAGKTRKYINDYSVTHFFHLIDAPWLISRIWGIMAGGVFQPTRMRWLHEDGRYIWVLGRGVIKNLYGERFGFGVFDQFSEHKSGVVIPSREEAAPEAERVYGLLRDSRDGGKIQVDKDGFALVNSMLEVSVQLTNPGSILSEMLAKGSLRIRFQGNTTTLEVLRNSERDLLKFLNSPARRDQIKSGTRVHAELPAREGRSAFALSLIKRGEEFVVAGGRSTGSYSRTDMSTAATGEAPLNPRETGTRRISASAPVVKPGGLLDRVQAALEGRALPGEESSEASPNPPGKPDKKD